MGELINLRRVKKVAERAAKEEAATVNRLFHGTPKHVRKLAKAEKKHTEQKIEAHKLDSKEPPA